MLMMALRRLAPSRRLLTLAAQRHVTVCAGIESTFDDSAVAIVTSDGQILADCRTHQDHSRLQDVAKPTREAASHKGALY
jgi:hypothetical protein